MAKLSTEELLDAFKEMTLLELEFVKQFEEVRGPPRPPRSPSPPSRWRCRPGRGR